MIQTERSSKVLDSSVPADVAPSTSKYVSSCGICVAFCVASNQAHPQVSWCTCHDSKYGDPLPTEEVSFLITLGRGACGQCGWPPVQKPRRLFTVPDSDGFPLWWHSAPGSPTIYARRSPRCSFAWEQRTARTCHNRKQAVDENEKKERGCLEQAQELRVCGSHVWDTCCLNFHKASV